MATGKSTKAAGGSTKKPAEHASSARPARPRTPPRRPARYKRSAVTRARVIEAATECIAEHGFAGATMTAIAERAGVTWGAMQHQFGDKETILDAVLERCLDDLAAGLRGLREAEPDVAARVRGFVRRAAEVLKGPSYRAFFEITVQRRAGAPSSGQVSAWTRGVDTALTRAWSEIFGDVGLETDRLHAVQGFAFVVLSGIAAESVMFPDINQSESHLALLEAALVDALGDASRRQGGST